MKIFFKLFTLVLGFVLMRCHQETKEENKSEVIENNVKDNALDTEEPQNYVMPGLDHGLSQSPINISSEMVEGGDKHKITLNFKDEINKIDNLGHTVQLDFKEGSSITVDNRTFDFVQCHFHTPSEHLIDGQTFPLEMHIVNTMSRSSKEDTVQYLVISTLFKEGKENKFIAEFLNFIPKEEHSSNEMKIGKVRLAHLFNELSKAERRKCYFYKGSLTTPPFTESVRWCILKHIFEASATQIAALNKIEGNNARHVQALYGRMVMQD